MNDNEWLVRFLSFVLKNGINWEIEEDSKVKMDNEWVETV